MAAPACVVVTPGWLVGAGCAVGAAGTGGVAAGADGLVPACGGVAAGRATSRPRRCSEDGIGVVNSVFGVAAFLGFVLLVSQVSLWLFAASVAQTAALDGATHGARADQVSPVASARERATAVLGGMADDATVTGVVRPDVSGEVLRVTVDLRAPSGLVRGLGLTTIKRSAEARIEQ